MRRRSAANRVGIAIWGVILLSGCATQAQRTFKATNGAANVAFAQLKQCQADLNSNAAYSDLAQHLAIVPVPPPSLEQLADGAAPSDGQVAQLMEWHKGVQACRQQLLDSAQASFPFMVAAYQQNFASADAIFLRVAQKQITFGEANKELSQARLDGAARNRTASSAWTSELKEEHREEVAQRAAAIQAMAVSLQETGAAMQQRAQQQQLINAINRPVYTSCNQNGSFTNCTSQ